MYNHENVIAWDSEYVSYTLPGGQGEKRRNQNYTATLDVVNTNLECEFSRRVYRKRGSFDVNHITKFINGFEESTFDKDELPKLEDVKKELDKFFQNKLLITCGGIHDYSAIGLNMGDYDVFDLQTHWFRTKLNDYGVEIREPHSLRSLVKYYFKEDVQAGTHTSLEDAINTMKLFEVYKRIKLADDPDNIDKRLNEALTIAQIFLSP